MAVNNVNTTSSVGSFGTPRRGVSGLATGMDTDELIKGMTMSTRNKIAKHKQNRQVLTWQGDALRSITDKLNTLSKKYTSFSSSTNLMSQRFFAKTDISTTGANASKVSVTGVGSDQVSIGRIKQMASDETVSTEGVSLGAIVSGEIDFNAEVTQSNIAGKSISIKYGGGTHNITLSEDKDYSTPEKIVESLNELTKDYNISGSTKLSDRVKFELDNSSGEDKIVMSYVQESDGNNVEITGGSSEVLKGLGFSVGDKLTSSEKSITGSEMQDYNTTKTTADLLGGKAITFNLNGIMKTIKLPSAEALKEPEYTVEKLAKSIQASLDTVYGSGRIKVGATLGGSHTLNKLEFTTTDPKKPDGSGGFEKDDTSILKLTGDNGLFGKTGALGMTSGATNRLNLNASIKDAGFPGLDLSNAEVDADGNIKMQINGVDIEGITENTTVKDLMEKINATEGANVKVSYLEMSDKFVISSTVGGASGKVDISDALDSGKDNLASMIFGKEATRTKTAGQDAELTIKYKGTNEEISITRGSNSFSLEGMNVTLKGTFGYTAEGKVDAAAEEIGFAASAKTDEVMDTIKNMVKEYNEILEQVNKELTTKRDRKFAPLTDEQREAMSDKEVEKWESKAMAGMLFNNPDLRSLSSEMRFMFGQGASELGISVSSSYSDNGKIVIDEQKLKSALESNPDKVRDFFASPPESGTTGVMYKMKNTLEKYAKTEGVDKGILVNKAGSTFSPLSMTNNALSKQMSSIDKMIASLEGKLKTEEDRYQRQFTSLEQLVSKMNAQSGYLAQQFGG